MVLSFDVSNDTKNVLFNSDLTEKLSSIFFVNKHMFMYILHVNITRSIDITLIIQVK